jgi:succinoglycan biosynthesis transport protein ExoP
MLKSVGKFDRPVDLDVRLPPMEEESRVSLSAFLEVLRRQWPLIIGLFMILMTVPIAYLLIAPARYTAGTKLLVNTRDNQPFKSSQIITDQQVLAAEIESEVEVIRSEAMARAIVNNLQLQKNPDLFRADNLLREAIETVNPPPAYDENDPKLVDRAVQIVSANLVARRMAPTFIIQVEYTSLDPKLAAQIANAAADVYLVKGLDAALAGKERTNEWLQQRLKKIRLQLDEADGRVQAFKSDNDIVDTNRGLITDQQLSDVNAQLITARAATAEAKARLDRIRQINSEVVPDATVADALRNAVITRLRAQFLDLSAKEADWSARYGADHVAVQNVRAEMRQIKLAMSDELNRIAETYKSDFQIASTREESLRKSLDSLIGRNTSIGKAQIKLRELESSVQVYRHLYDAFLQKLEENTNQQTLPAITAQVVSVATPPELKSSPKASLVMTLGAAFAVMCAIGAAVLRETLNDVFRSAPDLNRLPGNLELLGILPRIAFAQDRPRDPSADELGSRGGVSTYVLAAPFSRFTETIRNVKVAIDQARMRRDVTVIGVVSSLPREGKTSFSANLAHLIASLNYRTLLIDGDLRNPSLTRELTPDAGAGLLEVLAHKRAFHDVVRADVHTGLHFLPAVLRGRLSDTAEVISANPMADLLDWARKEYEYVIVDLPPILPVVDVKASSHLIDAYLLVIEWNETRAEAVHEALQCVPAVLDRSLGVVFNKGVISALGRIEAYKGANYHKYYVNASGDVAARR